MSTLNTICEPCNVPEKMFVPVEKLPDKLCADCPVEETDKHYNMLPKESSETLIVSTIYDVLYDLYNTYNC